MPGGAGIIIANGAELIAVTTIGNIPKVAGITPPTLNDSILSQRADGVVQYITVGASYTSALGYAETFRTKGGIISEGLGLDTVVLGRGAAAGGVGNQRSVAIGTQATTGAANQAVVIGYQANGGGQECVVVGSSANTTLAAGVVIGSAAVGSGNGGGAAVVAIGNGTSARCNNSGNSTAIGNAAVAREGDTVIGHGASSNAVVGVFTNSNVVIGAFAHANISLAASVVIGAGAVADVVNAVAIGASTTAAHAGATVIGYGTSSISSFSLTIGAALSDVRTVLLGRGDTAATPAARLFRWTNASGVDNAAGHVTWRAPLSTGAAAPAKHIFEVGAAHGSDGVLQTPFTILELDGVAGVKIGANLDIGAGKFAVTAATGAVAITGTGTDAITATSSGAVNTFILDCTHAQDWGTNIAFKSKTVAYGYVGLVGSLIGSADHSLALFAALGNGIKLYTNGNNPRLTIAADGSLSSFATPLAITGALTGVTDATMQTAKVTALPAFAAGDKYVTVDAAGNFHISTLGPGA